MHPVFHANHGGQKLSAIKLHLKDGIHLRSGTMPLTNSGGVGRHSGAKATAIQTLRVMRDSHDRRASAWTAAVDRRFRPPILYWEVKFQAGVIGPARLSLQTMSGADRLSMLSS
jgi:hypothetical protein